MNRIQIIQRIINKKHAKTYLEIGVYTGCCFFNIKAPKKIGVDIKFKFPGKKEIIKQYIKNPFNFFNKYYKMSSDNFFATRNNLFEKRKIDVAFIDGLHEYKQVIKDVNNCLKFLNDDGVIVLHDCNPPSALAATPFDLLESAKKSPECMGPWFGDVWKAIVYFRSTRDDLNVFVLKCDCGLGILTKAKAQELLPYGSEDIDRLSYDDLEHNRQELLSLKEIDDFEIIDRG